MFGSAKNALLPDVLSEYGAQLNLNLIFLFYFLFDDRARQNETNLRLSSEVIRNLKLSSHILLTCTTRRLACL